MTKCRRADNVKLLGVVRRKRSALMVTTALQATAIFVLSLPADAQPAPNARPTGGVVVAGSAAIGQTANTTTINQSTQRAAVNWQSFDVGSQQRVDFRQPSASAMTLNRVLGPDPSRIAGRIDANGQVVLVNQSGVTFFKGAQVNTNGLMVSAIGITNQNFMAGKMVFDQPGNPNARVENQGTITVREAGLAALVAPQVANSGVINAKLGHVVLAGAKTATLDLYGDGLLSLDVSNQVMQAPVGADGKPVTALVTNTGVIVADGGTVQLTARAADGVVQNLVNAGGKIRAATVGNSAGTVALGGVGGSIVVEGQLSAPGRAPGTVGGNIEIATTGNVTIASSAQINASGKAGGGVVAVGTTLARAKGGPSVTPTVVAANVTVQPGASIAANATGTGNGGTVTVLSAGLTRMDGNIAANGGPSGGNGGFVETSGPMLGIGSGASINVGASLGILGTWLLDPFDIDITAVDSNTAPSTAAGTTTFTASNTLATIANTTIQTALLTENVVISTGGGGTDQGNITVSQPIAWATATTLTLDADNNIAINAAITGTLLSKALILAAGTTTATGSITISAPIDVNTFAATAGGSGTINLNSGTGAVVTTNGGGQTYGSPVVLQAAANVVDTLNGAIKFASTVDGTTEGGQSLTVTAGTGSVTFGGAVGANIALTTLSVIGPTTLFGDVKTIGKQTYNSAVTLGATAALTTFSGTVDFAGTVNAATAGAEGLTVVAGNATVGFNDAVGGTAALASLTVSGPTTLAGNVTTTGTQTYNGAVTLGASNTLKTTNAAITLNAPVAGGANTLTLSSGTGAQTLSGITTSGDLVLDTTGVVTLNAGTYTITGGANPYVFPAVTTNGTVTLGQATKFGVMTLGSNTTIDSSTAHGDLNFNGPIDATTPGGQGLTVTAGTGTVTFGGIVGGSTVLSSLDATAAAITLGGDITTTATLALDSTGAGTALAINKTLSASQVTLHSDGDITESGAISAALLIGSSSGNANFNGINSIGALGDLAATGNFTLKNVTAFDIVGTVTAGPITPPAPNSANADTISLTSTAGTLAIGTVGTIGVLDAGNVVLSAAGTISEPNGTIIANKLTATTTAGGDITLSSTANAVTTVTGASAKNGDVALVFGPTTTLTGSYTGNNLFFEAAGTGDTLQIGDAATGVTMTATAASNPRISLVADLIAEGSQPNTISAKGGTVELAPFTSGRGVSLAGTAGSHLLIDGTLFGDISTNTGTVVAGQFTDVPNGGTLNASGGNISIDGVVTLAGVAATMDLVSQGSITEPTGSLNVGSLIGNAVSGTLLAAGNSIGTVAFTATKGDVQVADSARLNVGSVNASNGNIFLASSNVAGINAAGANMVASPTGRIGFMTDAISGFSTAKLNSGTLELAPFSPPGTITLGAPGGLSVVDGDLVGATATLWRFGAVTVPGGSTPTTTANALVVGGAFGQSTVAIELDSTGAIGEAGGAALIADAVTGTAGATVGLGSANAVNTLNGFNVAGGSFTFGDGGVASLTVRGTVSAANVAIDNVATLNVDGTVSASGTARLGAGSGGVLINAGALVNGGTVDLDSAGGGVTESGGGLVTAATLISSTGVSGSVSLGGANSIGAVGAFVAGGSFDLIDSGATSLTVTGPLVADGVTISGAHTLTVTGDVAATTKGLLTAGTITLGAGAVVTGATLDLSAGSGGIALTGNAALGQAGALIDMTTSGGGVTEAATASVTAATLQSTGGIKGAVDLAGVGNKIGTIALFQVNGGPLSLVDTGPLDVTGTLSATGITIADSGALTVSGSLIATSDVSLTGSNITIPGLVSDGGSGTTSLIASAGSIDETGTLIAGMLSGSSAGSTNLDGALPTSNQVGSVGTFTVNTTGGNFDLSDKGNTTNLALTGPISAGGVDVMAGGSITVSGAVTATNGAVEFAAGAGVAINAGGTLSGGTVDLTSGGVVTEAGGTIIAGTLLSSGGIVGGIILNGSNNIGAIGSPSLSFFVNNGDFSLNDGGSASGLTILGLLFANNITITNLSGPLAIGAGNGDLDSKGALIVTGAAGLTVNTAGIIQGETIDLSFTSGGVTEAPNGEMLAGTLQSTGGIVGTVDLPGNLNAINNINSLTVTGGAFDLFDESGTVTNLRVLGKLAADSITIAAGNQLTVSGSLVAASAISLSGGSITISGLMSDGGFGTTTLNANNISEPGTIIAGTLAGTIGTADLTGATSTANRVMTIDNVDASSFSLRDGTNLVVTGTLAGGSSATLLDKGTLAIDGAVKAATVSAIADSITIDGLVSGGTVSLIGTTGSVRETGTLVAGTLIGSASTDANLSGATATTNQVGILNGFTAGAGFTLDDGIALTETNTVSGGPSATILDNGALAINGTVTAMAINLTADSIAIPGNVSGGTIALMGTVGAISETGTLIAGTLTGSAATNASLTGATTSTNHVGLVNGFTANSGFTLDDGIALTVANTVSGGTNATILDKGALAVNGMVTAESVGLTADSITIPGNVTGSTVMLTGTVGAISETGALIAGTLTGSAPTSATLTGASATTNQVGTLNGFKAGNGFTLNDGTDLTVTGTLAGGPSATILDNGALAINGAMTAIAIGLTANSITVSGNVVGGNSAALDATNGAIIINGAVSANAVGLTADGIVVFGNVTGNSASLNATNGAIAINGVVNGTTASLTGTSINIPGIVNGNSVTSIATAGAINETGALNIGTLTGAAANSASFTGTNSIASFGPFSSNGLTLIDNSNLGLIGVVNAGTSAAINVAGSLTIGGALIASTLALNATNGISIPGTVLGGNSVNLVTNGSISEIGALITNVLTGDAVGDVTLTGNTTSNQVGELGRFSSSGTFTLTDNVGLLITGPLSAPKIVITDANSPVTLADGAIIITSGTARPPGAIANADLPTAATSGFGAFLAVQSFTQVGTSTIEGNPSILRIDVTGPGNITFSQNTDTGLMANGTWLILGLQTGQATGSTFVQNLDVIQTGGSGSTQLSGTVGGFSGPAAAGAAGIQPGPGSNFRFNSCPIASVNCVLVSALALPTANPLNDINVGSLYNPNDQDDLLLPIVSDQDY